MFRKIYEKEKTREIVFPVGGIGTGSIGLSGNGHLVDWEIFNKPNKGTYNGNTHLAIKVEEEGKIIDARILQGDYMGSYMGHIHDKKMSGMGFGIDRRSMEGMPHFRETSFEALYPFATINYKDNTFPGTVKLISFNPLIPLNDKDSSLPVAFFEIEINNDTARKLSYTVNFALTNPNKGAACSNHYSKHEDFHCMHFTSQNQSEKDMKVGNLSLITDGENVAYQEYWYFGYPAEALKTYWNEFIKEKPFENRELHKQNKFGKHSNLASTVTLLPGETKKVKFILAWYYPNVKNYWSKWTIDGVEGIDQEDDREVILENYWKNYYATIFDSSLDVAIYSMKNYKRLHEETLRFTESLYSSSLPQEVMEAVGVNLSIFRTATCLRLEDGSLYGFEGCFQNEGCCEGTCTHVWNYAYSIPYLFPKLERSMRELEYKYNFREDGKLSFRLQLPVGMPASNFRACADGQFGTVIKMYREWKISGDTDWLKSHWEKIQNTIAYAWSPTNEDLWDPYMTGVLTGRQHHTLDWELFGANSWLTGYYLAALKAAAIMAEALGDIDSKEKYSSLFSKGRTWVDKNLFNGEYYHQKIDIKDKDLIKKFLVYDNEVVQKYWDEETEEIKYQVYSGCVIDQIVAQWHSNLIGLGDIFDTNQRIAALKSIYRYNFKKSMRGMVNCNRLYAVNDEAGTLICEYPNKSKTPSVELPYSGECMNGFEYEVACHMIQEGMEEQGRELVRAVRNRYDGTKRNPFNEFECGSHYARSMSSYALLLTYSGFQMDMVSKSIIINPLNWDRREEFKSFWSTSTAWGTFEMNSSEVSINVLFGELILCKIELPFIKKENIICTIEDIEINFHIKDGSILFDEVITIKKDEILKVDY